MNLKATVLHNVGLRMFERYNAEGSDLYHAHDFQIVADNADKACDLAWLLCNVDDANHLNQIRPDLAHYGPQVAEYRSRRNRSLSVGDVVVLNEAGPNAELRYVGSYAVEPIGWRSLPISPPYDPDHDDEGLETSTAYNAAHRYLEAYGDGGTEVGWSDR